MPPGRDGEDMAVEQLVLPKGCHATVLSLAHSIPLADHVARIRRRNVSYSGSIGQLYTETWLSTAGPVNHARRCLNIVYNQHHSFPSSLLILNLRGAENVLQFM